MAGVFCKFWKIFQSTYFMEHFWTDVSESITKPLEAGSKCQLFKLDKLNLIELINWIESEYW